MRKANVFVNGILAGVLAEEERGRKYRFHYIDDYRGDPVSLTIPVGRSVTEFDRFPPFLDGLLPEGMQLDALVRKKKIDNGDLFAQLVQVGGDLVGAVSVEEAP